MRVRGHRAAIGVGERNLVLSGPVKLCQHVLAPRAPLADRGKSSRPGS
jgi:hypothetical protein